MDTSGINHIVLTVTDVGQARKFYGDVLGFDVQGAEAENYFFFSVAGVSIWVITHESTPSDDRFSEFRVGLDHLSFTAPDEAALNAMAEKLKAAGVDTKGVEVFAPSGNKYIAFRDPDNTQLEYWLN
jgi:glyoxylase I family protein